MDRIDILNILGQIKEDLENNDLDARDLRDILLKFIKIMIKIL